MSKDDVKAEAAAMLRRLQKLPDIVRRYFNDPNRSDILD
jgi:hypothetical protein